MKILIKSKNLPQVAKKTEQPVAKPQTVSNLVMRFEEAKAVHASKKQEGCDKCPKHEAKITKLEAKIAELEAVRNTANQFMLEVAHAMQSGPTWYTRGESGLRSQIHMWIGRMQKALAAQEKP